MQKRLKIKCNLLSIDYNQILTVYFYKNKNKIKFYVNVLKTEINIDKK